MLSDDEWSRLRDGLRLGQVFTGTVVRVPKPGAIGVFVDVGLPVGGFVDVLLLPYDIARWPSEGTVAAFELWWADPDPRRQQIRLKPADPAFLREDFDELMASVRPNWPSLIGHPLDHGRNTSTS
ncbi:hypothetical protein ABZV77_06060 [Streptomyces sp. NPDC004732]|uniref:hypothetical protein n=1 Tax=Streptomyces sp. NPDC004732 TaxID=3154290 RepID=UPI0033A16FA7